MAKKHSLAFKVNKINKTLKISQIITAKREQNHKEDKTITYIY